jgi:hypothetical protein
VIFVSMLLSVTGLYWCNATSPSTGTGAIVNWLVTIS